MAIPEQVLSSWSALGAQQGSATTYNSIKTALESHSWPDGMRYRVYLQGSYANHTNIRGDSDVDIVFEGTSTFYHNVPDTLRLQYNLGVPARYSWNHFRHEVKKALENYYGSSSVVDGNKCLSVAGKGHRLNADVIPCNTYRSYQDPWNYAEGIVFWTRSDVRVVNFPKLHKENGVRKNEACSMRYKPSIRMFKNARNRCRGSFPSYFLECLLYNVPNTCFERTLAGSYYRVVQYLVDAKDADTISTFVCQNGQHELFGSSLYQADLASARRVIGDLTNLWNQWS